MKKIIPFLLFLFFSFQLNAQVKQDTIMYAMSASTDNEFAWFNIEQLNVKTCKKKSEIFNKRHHRYIMNNDRIRSEEIEEIYKYTHNYSNEHFATTNMACGIAYSKKTKRVYFFPLQKNELRWVNIGSNTDSVKEFGKVTSGQIYVSQDNYSRGEDNVSRATIALNGKGYGITNDGKHLYEFSDQEVPVITDLGALIDISERENQVGELTNWGGDIIGLTDGNLLLITGNGKVFSIDIKTRETTFLVKIKGVDKNCIISGAAVDEKNQLIVSSAHGGGGFYKVNIDAGASATQVKNAQMPYSVSDLTSANLLTLHTNIKKSRRNINISPNPIQNNSFKIAMNDIEKGNYSLQISDQNGKAIVIRQIKVISSNTIIQQSILSLPKGIYHFLIYDAKNEIVFHDKIFVSN